MHLRAAALGATVALLAGCAQRTTEEPRAPVATTTTTSALQTTSAVYPVASSDARPGAPIVVAASVLSACHIEGADGAPPSEGVPSLDAFAFDSAELRPGSEKLLGELAVCLAPGGRLADARLRVVGHADERGTIKYNRALGERRALAVQSALSERGVPEDRLEVRGRGARDGQGAERASRKLDRRVVIELAADNAPRPAETP